MSLIYKKNYTKEVKSITDQNSYWEFIYKFINEFNYKISEIDIKSDDHEKRFKITFSHALPTRFVQIDYDGNKGIIDYKIAECEDSEIAYRREVKFIGQY